MKKGEKSGAEFSVLQLLSEKQGFNVGQKEEESCCSEVKTGWKRKEINEKFKKSEQKV